MESQTHSKGGRPTSYKPEFDDQLIEFFKSFTDEPYTKEVISKTTKYYDEEHGGGVKESNEDYKIICKKLPTLFGFSQKIGVEYHTILRWSKLRIGKAPEDKENDTRPYKYPGFCSSYKKAMHFQKEFITGAGMGGVAPSSFVIFTAKNVIGWRDKNEIGFTDPNGKEAKPGYIILPARKSDEDALKEYTDQEQEAETPTL